MRKVKVSKRQRQIIEMLLERKNEMTVGEIAQELKVSSRTVHRSLLEIDVILETFGVQLLKKAGTGIQLYADPDRISELKRQLAGADTTEYTTEERKLLMICKLLENEEPIKLFSLSHELQAAIPTVSNDLDELEGWVRKNQLTLVRKRGYGVEILGTERVKRRAIGILAQDHLDDSVLFGSTNEPIVDPVSRQLLSMVGRENFFQIEKALWKLDEKYPTHLSESAYTYMLIRLSIALTRYQQGMVLKPSEIYETEWKLPEEEMQLFRFVSSLLQLSLPPQEEVYMTGLMQSWNKTNDPDRGLIHDDIRLLEFITKLIRYVGERLALPLDQDRSLKEGLLLHIDSAFIRVMNGEYIRNPLLSQIRKDYEELFTIVKTAVLEIAKDFVVPDEEIAFLVMHFGAALERMRQKSLRVRALLVCTSGIGSSKLLAVRIEKELPQIELLAHISWYEASRISKDEYDLVISTVDLPLSTDQYIKLSPLLTKDEVAKLQAFIQTLTVKQPENRISVKEQQTSLSLLSNIGQYSQIIVQLIDQFQVHEIGTDSRRENLDLRTVVRGMCERLYEQNRIDSIEPIVERLLQREKMGSQVIANTGLALFHTRSETVNRPILALFRFDAPVSWKGLDNRKVRQIMLMLGPKELDKQTLEVLSEFSALLLEPGLIERLEKDDEASIKKFFSNNFELFIKTKLDWRE